jgi:hypothetical protein
VPGGAGEHQCPHVVAATVEGGDQRLEGGVVDGIAPFGSVDRHDGDVTSGLGVDHRGTLPPPSIGPRAGSNPLFGSADIASPAAGPRSTRAGAPMSSKDEP